MATDSTARRIAYSVGVAAGAFTVAIAWRSLTTHQRSLFSYRSAWSVLSASSVLSIGSAASVLSIGSFASVLSIGSSNSMLSIGSDGGWLSIGRSTQASRLSEPMELLASTRR
jgi:hypothetical protein